MDLQHLPGDTEASGIAKLDLDQLGIRGFRIVDQEDRSLLGRDDRMIGDERQRAGNEQSEYGGNASKAME